MRKAFAVLALLLVLALGFGTAAAVTISSSADAVSLQHTTLYGDVSAAAGLQVTSRLQLHRRLFWEVDFPLTEAPGAAVTFENHLLAQTQPGREHVPSGVMLSAYSIGGASTSGSFDEENWESLGTPFRSLAPVFRDVAARAPAGEDYTETVYVKDYFDHYPLSVDVNVVRPDRWLLPDGSEPSPEALSELFAGFFRIPVLEENTLTVSIKKNATGLVQSVDVYDPENTGPELYGPSAVDQHAAYFALNFGEKVDVSLIPGGAGIYCLPYDAPGADSEALPVIHPERLANVFPLPQEAQVSELLFSPQGNLLLLFLQDGWLQLSELALPAVPGEALQLLNSQRVLPVTAEGYVRGSVLFDDCLLTASAEGAFALLQLDGGRYRPVLTGDFTAAEQAGMSLPFGPDMTFLWDGQRLAAAQYAVQMYHDGCNDIYAAVFTADGLQYVGHIASSLSRNVGQNSPWSVYPEDEAPLRLTLPA